MNDVTLPLVLACGADTVYLTIVPCDSTFQPIKQTLDEQLQEELEALKQKAQEKEEPVPTRWSFDGERLFMKDKGARGGAFPWVLECPKLTVCIGRGKRTGIVGQVRLSSEYLWCCRQRGEYASVVSDLGGALSAVQVFLTTIYGKYILCKLSSIDLAVDFTHWDVGLLTDYKEHFVRRAQTDTEFPTLAGDELVNGPDQPFNRWQRLTGLAFGRHASPIYGKLYDKTHEIRYQAPKKIWMHQHWLAKKDEQGRPLWDGKMPVWRLEISARREAIVQFSLDGQQMIDDAFSILEHIERLWQYCVGHPGGGDDGLPDGWLRYVIPTEDTNRSRWPVHPSWQVLQGAFAEPAAPEPEHEREEREREELLQEVDDYLAAHPWKMEVKKQPKRLRKSKKKQEDEGSYVVLEPPPGVDTRAFVRMCQRKVDMDKATAAVAGWSTTIEAWRRASGQGVAGDISDTFQFIYTQVNEYLSQKRKDFDEMVDKRQERYRLKKAVA